MNNEKPNTSQNILEQSQSKLIVISYIGNLGQMQVHKRHHKTA